LCPSAPGLGPEGACYGKWVKDKVLSAPQAKFSDILSILIPLFEKYPILGVKAKDFEGFR